MNKKANRYWIWALILNPVTLIIYGIGCYFIYELCMFGGVRRRVPVIIACIGVIGVWLIVCLIIYIHRKKKTRTQDQSAPPNDLYSHTKQTIYKTWYVIAIIIFIIMTGVTIWGIYHSAINYNGKFSWFIEDIKNKRTVEIKHNNIYEDGIDGILQDIEQKVTMPKELYISNDFELDFAADGTILAFDTYLYGKNGDGKTESFLVSYDSNQSDNIIVYLNGEVNSSYDESMSLTPLAEMLKIIQLKGTVSKWYENEYSILYKGVRDWGYNTDGIVYIDKDGKTTQAEDASNEIKGYTVSVYVQGKEVTLIPWRYIATWEKVPASYEKETETTEPKGSSDTNFYFNDSKVYRLAVVDAALGSRFYSLKESNDGGNTWQMINQDPFLGNSGVAAGICFIDEKLGFISLSHSGGSYGELYRTNDGGVTFEPIVLPEVQVKLDAAETYNPFDLPKVPTKEGNTLQLLVTQGQDGDYNAGCNALYQSKDDGVTWEYVKEVIE